MSNREFGRWVALAGYDSLMAEREKMRGKGRGGRA